MLVHLRHVRTDLALPAIQLAAVALALRFSEGAGTAVAIALLLGTGLLGWVRALRHARLIADTPTARIASAAQGYTELQGRGQPLDGMPLLSPVNGLPLLWYRLVTERRQSDGKWRVTGTETSDASFLLDDGSGQCVVDPDGAEMLVRRCDVFRNGDLRYRQWSLIRHDRIYVLGDFATLGSADVATDSAAQVRELLAQWKLNHPELLARFDLDGNGEIDIREWELARAQARREVRRMQTEALAAPDLHVVHRPDGRRLFLISDRDPEEIGRNYRWLAAYHAAVFVGAAGAGAWFVQIGVI
ncbi:hypothetical protein ACUH78_14540 [Thauera sp. ZXT1-4]|uniref:hypothetical protein n=1 Tax=Thauera sp. ZXT1-4 TaxID=3460294 RepID=UPI004040CA3B